MTTVVICRDKKGSYRGFYCMGHAGYARRGKPDILCAAISALTIGTINSLEELAGERLAVTENEETGFLKCDFESILQEKSCFLMDSMVFCLENISREYGGKYLQVKFEEV
ncbi:ribosomal-processing cysteine protease Prp [Acetatifactor aquisgranensis]|uniref:ribosomal-processing cysteine protease Prp n=1 Tax=Acetatifactor aquisgranensis TaxID=2941233 RepID=UPI00203B22CD|nr:ribosomal-processing cysteine protease Prp [Acetatifactor aquisgranensis]MCI8542532.1 ribosomal-processing cysteine protease Prp [Lachnospiraceae bacterium]